MPSCCWNRGADVMVDIKTLELLGINVGKTFDGRDLRCAG